MRSKFIFISLLALLSLGVKAQCPELKKYSSDNKTIKIDLTHVSKNTAAILYKVESEQPFLDFDKKPEIKNNSIIFSNLSVGDFIIRINEKECVPLYVGKQEKITIK